MSTFANQLRDISEKTLEERSLTRKKKMFSLMTKYHPLLKSKILDAAKKGKKHLDFSFDEYDFMFEYPNEQRLSSIDHCTLVQEMFNPDSEFLPLTNDGVTRDSFTGLQAKQLDPRDMGIHNLYSFTFTW